MKRIRLLGLALMAIFAVSIAATTAAQAANPILEILPEKTKFTFESKGETKLRTLGGKEVTCGKVSGSGEATSKRLGTIEFGFLECKSAGIACLGLEDTVSGHITVKAEFHIRHLLAAGNGVSMMILVGHVHFSCSILLFLVLGSVCSDDVLNKEAGEPAENKLLAEMFVNFLESAANSGDPAVTEVDTDNSLGMEKCELMTKEGTGGAYDSSSQKGSGLIKAPTGKTLLIDLTGAHE